MISVIQNSSGDLGEQQKGNSRSASSLLLANSSLNHPGEYVLTSYRLEYLLNPHYIKLKLGQFVLRFQETVYFSTIFAQSLATLMIRETFDKHSQQCYNCEQEHTRVCIFS